MVRNDNRFKAHFSGALLKAFQSSFTMFSPAVTTAQGQPILRDEKINMKIFGKGTAQQAARRTEIRDLIDARIGVVNQAGDDVTTDKKVIKLIGDVMAKVLLSLYCTEKGTARTGSNQSLSDGSWRLELRARRRAN